MRTLCAVLRRVKSIWAVWLCAVSGLVFLSGCETTTSGTTQVTGKVRAAVTEWDVDLYQDPAGQLSWIPDMEIPVKYEEVAKLESSATVSNNNPMAIEEKSTQIVSDLKKKAARLGANGVIVREVQLTEEVVERHSDGYQTVRYPDGSYGQVEVPVQTYYERVYKVKILADSVFLDWNTVWTGEPTS